MEIIAINGVVEKNQGVPLMIEKGPTQWKYQLPNNSERADDFVQIVWTLP